MEDTFAPDAERHAADPFEVTEEVHHEQYHDVHADPKGDPVALVSDCEVYIFGEEGVVPDELFVVERPDDEDVYSRMWAFIGEGGIMHAVGYYRHRYRNDEESPPDRGRHDCCFKIERSHGLSKEHCPSRISDVAADVADAPIAMPDATDRGANASG